MRMGLYLIPFNSVKNCCDELVTMLLLSLLFTERKPNKNTTHAITWQRNK